MINKFIIILVILLLLACSNPCLNIPLGHIIKENPAPIILPGQCGIWKF